MGARAKSAAELAAIQQHEQNLQDALNAMEMLCGVEKKFCHTHSQRNAVAHLIRILTEAAILENRYLRSVPHYGPESDVPF